MTMETPKWFIFHCEFPRGAGLPTRQTSSLVKRNCSRTMTSPLSLQQFLARPWNLHDLSRCSMGFPWFFHVSYFSFNETNIDMENPWTSTICPWFPMKKVPILPISSGSENRRPPNPIVDHHLPSVWRSQLPHFGHNQTSYCSPPDFITIPPSYQISYIRQWYFIGCHLGFHIGV